MLGSRFDRSSLGRVNPHVPLVVFVAGLIVAVAANRDIGVGVAIGTVLAVINSVILSGRVELAADSGDMAGALMVMQLGLLVTFAIIGVVTVVLVHFSVPLAVGSAVGFAVTQTLVLVAFYFLRGRADVAAGRQTS
jgi:hypothetical protein